MDEIHCRLAAAVAINIAFAHSATSHAQSAGATYNGDKTPGVYFFKV
jgi:hypothetical protein